MIFIYQILLSPLMGGHCRYHPSCSQYAQQALRQHPLFKALSLILSRLLRCRPFSTFGDDPVPKFSGGKYESK